MAKRTGIPAKFWISPKTELPVPLVIDHSYPSRVTKLGRPITRSGIGWKDRYDMVEKRI
jgi:hypothetical protein